MTNEEAKKILLNLKKILTGDYGVVPYSDDDIIKAVNIAADALDQQEMRKTQATN